MNDDGLWRRRAVVDLTPDFEAFLAALDAEAWSEVEFRRWQQFMTDSVNTQKLLRAVDAGLVLSPRAVNDVVQLGFMATTGAARFRQQPGFDDDRLFTPTRFAMVFAYHKRALPHDMSVMGAANAQVGRMLASGRVSPDEGYLETYLNQVNAVVLGGGDWDVWVPLAAHLPGVWALMERRVAATAHNAGRYGSNGEEADAMLHAGGTRTLAAAGELRERLFRDHWLRSALGGAEWGEARGLALPVLKELYADVWAAGYAGYHERLLGQCTVGVR